MTYLKQYKIWLSPQPTRKELIKDLIEIADNQYNRYSVLFKSKVDGLTSKDLLQSYLSDNNHIEKTDKREARYGEYYQMSVSTSIGMANLTKLVGELIQEIIYGKVNLPYVVLYTRKKGNYYLRIWIADREWTNEVHRYARDYYYNKNTGKSTNKLDPNAELRCRKGDPKLDKDGKEQVKAWSRNKTTIFTESYEFTQPRFYDILEAIFIKLKNTVKNYFARRKNGTKPHRVYVSEKGGHRLKEHLYREVASLQYFIQQQCFQEIVNNFDYIRWERDGVMGFNQGNIDITDPYGNLAKGILALYHKYQARIKKGEFHTQEGNLYRIFKGVHYKQGVQNVTYLKSMFKADLKKLLSV